MGRGSVDVGGEEGWHGGGGGRGGGRAVDQLVRQHRRAWITPGRETGGEHAQACRACHTMGEKMLRTIWQLPLNAVDGVPETILEIGRQARQARIDLAACAGVAFKLGLGGPDMLARREVGRRSEARGVGKECGSTVRYWWTQ